MVDEVVVVLESPWARAWRSFLSAVAADPVVVALVVTLAAGVSSWRDQLVPAGLSVVAAIIVAGVTLLLSFSERWKAATQTPFRKGVAQFFQKFAVGLGVIQVASFNSAQLFDAGDKLLGALGAAVVSGLLTYALNRSQKQEVIDVEALN
jgi:hypothetical protein